MARLSVQTLQYGLKRGSSTRVKYQRIARSRGLVRPLKAPVRDINRTAAKHFGAAFMAGATASVSLLSVISPTKWAAVGLAEAIAFNTSETWRSGYDAGYTGDYAHHWEPSDRVAQIGSIQSRFETFSWASPQPGAGDWLEWYIPNPDSGSGIWPRFVENAYSPGVRNVSSLPQPITIVPRYIPSGPYVLDPFKPPVLDPRLRPIPPIRYTPPVTAPAPSPVAPPNGIVIKLGNGPARVRTQRQNVARPRRGDKERKLIAGGKAYAQILRWINRTTESLDFVQCVGSALGTYGGPKYVLKEITRPGGPRNDFDIDRFVDCLVKNAVEDALIGGIAVAYKKQRRMRFRDIGVDDLPGMKGPAFGTSGGPTG